MGLRIKRIEKKENKKETKLDKIRKKVMPIREDHPIFEISGNTFNHEHIFEIGLRPTIKIDGVPVFEVMEQVRVVGLLPDFKMALGKDIHEFILSGCHDHMMGTTVNQFVKRLNWRNTANIENIVLFPKRKDGSLSDEIDFNRLAMFLELLLNSFMMLDCSFKENCDDKFMLFIKSRGEWTNWYDQPLPKLKGVGIEFSKTRLKEEFNRFLPEMKSGVAANHAIKAQILSVISSHLYSVEFDGEVDPDLLEGPHRKLNVIQKKEGLADFLKEKVQEQKIVGPGGE